jgi:iron complex transport system substrate-binding protein
MEAVIAQEPDLIITQAGVQTTETGALREMGIPVVSTLARTFDDVIELYRAFGAILGERELAEQKIEALTESRQGYIDAAPDDGKSVVILYLTASALSVKLDGSIAGDIAKSLKIRNIASDLPPDTIGSENTPLDIEYIVQQNPDIVLVTSMIGSNELAVETMQQHFADNQAWQSVEAVAEGSVAYLPQEYFLYNCGPYFDEAVRYMACCVYPEVFGEVSEWYGNE